jgi:PAS domain S-box-containing protein
VRNLLPAISELSIISYTDKQGKIKYVNSNFISISGFSKEELVGSDHRIINSGFHGKAFWVGAWQTISKGNVWRNEVLNKGKSGNYYWVDTFIYPFKDDNGNIEGYFSIRNDITQRKQNEIELREKNELLEKIAWVQSHELRRPLTNILGLINLFETDSQNTDLAQLVLTNLKNAVQELDGKIHLIVGLTNQINSGKTHNIRTAIEDDESISQKSA